MLESRRPGQWQVAATMQLRSAFTPRLRPRFIVANAPVKDLTSRLRCSQRVSGRPASLSRPLYVVLVSMGCTIEHPPQMQRSRDVRSFTGAFATIKRGRNRGVNAD